MCSAICAAAFALNTVWATTITYPARRVAGWTITITETM